MAFEISVFYAINIMKHGTVTTCDNRNFLIMSLYTSDPLFILYKQGFTIRIFNSFLIIYTVIIK